MTTIAVATMGSLVPFLRFNFSKKRKIFMGDTGSMIIGFLIAFFVVHFLSQVHVYKTSFFYSSAPVLVLSIVFFPLLDTLRIFFIRAVIQKKSPFRADRNHLHHGFINLGYTHKQTTLCIVVVNAILFVLALLSKDFDIHLQLCLLLATGTVLYSVMFIYHWLFKNKTPSKIAEQAREIGHF